MIENNFKISPSSNNDEIAVIGFGLRFPGDVVDLEQFWSLLMNRIDGVRTIDPDRWNHSFYLNSEIDNCKLGSIEWKDFDPLFFGMSPKDAPSTDPQQRLLLKVAWEAFEDAGIDPFSKRSSNTSRPENSNQEKEYLIPFSANSKYSLDKYLSEITSLRLNGTMNSNIEFIDFVKHQVYSRTQKLIQRSVIVAKNWDDLINSVEDIPETQAPKIPIFSTVTAQQFTENDKFDASYIYENISQPVKFQQSLGNIYKYLVEQQDSEATSTDVTFIEFAPHPTLAYYLKKSVPSDDFQVTVLNPLNKKSNDTELQQFKKTVISSFVNGKSSVDFSSQFSIQEKQDHPSNPEPITDVVWNKCCVGKISTLPHSNDEKSEKVDIEALYNNNEEFVTINTEEMYKSIKLNAKISYGPQFRRNLELKFGKDFMISKVNVKDPTSIFDKYTFFNPAVLDNLHMILINNYFPNGCVLKGIEDMAYYTSNVPKSRSGIDYIYIKSTYLKFEDDSFNSVVQAFLPDGTILFNCEKCIVSSFKKNEDTNIIKHPANDIYSSFYQPKESNNVIVPKGLEVSKSIGESIRPFVGGKDKRIIRILELQSGQGVQSKIILEELNQIVQTQNDQKSNTIEIEYTFTNENSSSFAEAQQILNQFNSRSIDIVFKVVNYGSEFQKQDINNGYYDILIVNDPVSENVLTNIFKVLKPTGSLLFNSEIDSATLKAIGFENISSNSATKPNINQLSTLAIPAVKLYPQCVIYGSQLTTISKFTLKLKEFYLTISESVAVVTTIEDFLKLKIGSNDLIIFSKGLEPLHQDNFTQVDMEYTQINQFLLSKNLQTKHILLTSNALVESANYLNASLIGVFRSFTDQNIQIFSIDLDSTLSNIAIEKIEYLCNSDHFIEREFVVRGDQVLIENWRREDQPKTFKTSSYETNHLGYTLDFNHEITFVPYPPNLQPTQVLVRVKSIGLTYNDSLYYGKVLNSSSVGMEFSGDVIQVGSSVQKFKVGDAVVGLQPSKDCYTHISYLFAIAAQESLTPYLQEIFDAISRRELQLSPIKEYPMTEIKDAYSRLIERKAIGKIVVSDLDDTLLKQSIAKQTNENLCVKSDYSIKSKNLGKTVLVTGQSGSIFEIIRWMVRYATEGVDIIVLSQSPIKFELEFIQKRLIQLNQPSRIHFRRVDISNIELVRDAINDVYSTNNIKNSLRPVPPIESVIHFAFGLADCLVEDITLDKFNFGHSAKTMGALNLHTLSLEMKWNLKNFILCSSIVSSIGASYQSVYTSSTLVVNSLSNYRRSIGLPSTTLIWGPLSVGAVKTFGESLEKTYLAIGYRMLSVQKIIGTLDLLIQNPQQQLLFTKLADYPGFKPLICGWSFIKNKYLKSAEKSTRESSDEDSVANTIINKFASIK
eukprot:gene7402-9097_t